MNHMNTALESKLSILGASLDGELYYDSMMRALYATDASVYRELPLAVAMPRHAEDVKQLIHFARTEGTSLIPRTAGTSLAGQCVGQGIVVDCSRYMTRILELNEDESWVRVQPGVVRDDLNVHLKPHGFLFGPNTSTSNRAMIGGMVGNNSSGTYSLVYGTTRDHLMEVRAILSDGSDVIFKELTEKEFQTKLELDNLEGEIYRHLVEELSDEAQRNRIRKEFPKASIHRRNTGYAVDLLLETEVFSTKDIPFNFCKLIAGSEGTLAFITEIKIHIDPVPPPEIGLICVHFTSVGESLKAVLKVMEHTPRAVELMDKIIMDRTKDSLMYRDYRFFIKGDPEAILVIEVGGETEDEVDDKLDKLEIDLKNTGFGYHYHKVFGDKIKKVWNLRKAGLGLLFNIKGDRKYVAVIEDTAVHIEDLPDYIAEFGAMMDRYGQTSVYYAHAGAGEIHLRPILNLKDPDDRKMFRKIGHDTAVLVKKYNGSLSGEHGDGRVRGEFIPIMVGEENYEMFRRLKDKWDPKHIFNPGKIVNAPPMDQSMRFDENPPEKRFDTAFDFNSTDGILRATEKCNGSGDCRKTHLSGGTMCPSYMATRQEKDTTRARANILREVLTRSEDENPFANDDIYNVMDLCLSCKGCASECPSNVNVATLKAEFQHQYYKTHGIPFRSKAFANISRLNGLGSIAPGLTNFFLQKAGSGLVKSVLKLAPKRKLPGLYHTTLRKWYKKVYKNIVAGPVKAGSKGKVYFFCDEFTNFNDTEIGIIAIRLLHALGYEVIMPNHVESGRAHISKGILNPVKKLAKKNVEIFSKLVSDETPLIGLEPSAILSFRDEYPLLVPDNLKADALSLGENALMIDEFLSREIDAGNLDASLFSDQEKDILLHGHCHQKALSSVNHSQKILSLPSNYEVEIIPSGCCGMAGSFGYEAEHFDLSMKIGELVLFPTIRKAPEKMVVAPGTSCRHQIQDGTDRKAMHPVEVLWNALEGRDRSNED